ncbi:SDR family oxidoreductase [uncultured Fibrella sp.]|uniref:SDR family oxidoreductase n=1 Tax=uncultured Fibrella sp. TaxID=1284596 RepID=UPI0035CC75C9
MQLTNNTILITGGATGIGLSLAAAFLREGNTVIVCGRRESALRQAKETYPELHTRVADLTSTDDRRSLAEWLAEAHPNLNILVNNAGIQRQFMVKQTGVADAFIQENEIEINLTAPIHLTLLLISRLLKQPEAAVINVSSGLGYVPLAIMPVYCATKAALQSFSISLRQQLAGTPVQVFDVVPPIVDTELDQGARKARGQTDMGIEPDEVAKATLKGLKANAYAINVGRVKALRIGSRLAPALFLKIMNKRVQK